MLTDPDSPDFDGGLLRVDLGTSGLGNDRLGIRDQGTGAGQIGVSGNTVTYGGIVVGTHAGGSNGTLNTVLAHELTDGVAQIDVIAGGAADSGVPLFDQNVATLWPACGQVLTILEVGSQQIDQWPTLDNAIFFTNVAEWIGFLDGMPFSDGFESGDTSKWSATHP